MAAEDPGHDCLAAGQVGEPPSQGRGGTQAVVTPLLLGSLLSRPAGGGGHVHVRGTASEVTGLSGESSHPLPLLQGQTLRPDPVPLVLTIAVVLVPDAEVDKHPAESEAGPPGLAITQQGQEGFEVTANITDGQDRVEQEKLEELKHCREQRLADNAG